MPRAPTTPKTSVDVKPKPYDRSSPISDDLESDTSCAKSKTRPKKSAKKAWTNDEWIQLFETVAKAGMGTKIWEGAIEGRTPNQCYKAWLQTVAPFIKKALASKPTR